MTGLTPPAPDAAKYFGIVDDPAALLALGKALFWDVQVGAANNQACASCHFHAGGDTRKVNQLNPGTNRQPVADNVFDNGAAPNMTLRPEMFPFHKLADPTDRESAVTSDSNDVVSSQGSFQGPLLTERNNDPVGQRTRCGSGASDTFFINVNGSRVNTRKVEPRNTPTMINAVFNFRNFWDGRANNVFNGINPFGRRATAADPTARVFTTNGSSVQGEILDLENMSAASQAVGPVLSSFEMTCDGKSFASIGRRLMQQRALQGQKVAADDSVFSRVTGGSIVDADRGLTVNYRQLVRAAFKPKYWNSNNYYVVNRTTGGISISGGAVNGNQIDELNFSMFFGLAIDAYERLLISDQSPFDNQPVFNTDPAFADARAGRDLFTGPVANCVACHDGALFSGAATWQGDSTFHPIERMPMADPRPALYDNGFYNIGVRPTFEDIGVGNVDPFGNPLSFTRQFVLDPRESNVGVDRFSVEPCKFAIPFSPCSPLPADLRSHRVAVDGAFKVPILRNVALTPPYFHNGGQKSLDEVVAFYNRGGDRRSVNPSGDTTGTGEDGRPVPDPRTPVQPRMGGSNADIDVRPLGLDAGQQAKIVAFLKSLTDRRVACHKAPFDHPALTVANGQLAQDANRDGNADDRPMTIRAVGAGGYANCNNQFEALNSGDLFISSPAFDELIK